MRLRHLAAVLAVMLGAAGCGQPKYVTYRSIHNDWKTFVPWGWNVITDDASGFSATNFLGPFEPEFFLGIPSLSVRWHEYGVPHQLRGGQAEIYRNSDDYIRKMLAEVYPDRELESPIREVLTGDKRKAKHFVVLSPVEAPDARWGVSEEVSTKKVFNFRKHAYAVVPLERGFYVLVYPATRDGYPLYVKHFEKLINGFVVLTEGPGGPKPEAAKISFTAKDQGKP